jgi:putative restriction endonuclease
MSMDDDFLDRAASIRVFSSNDRRAPHKPLLLLSAIAALQEGLPIALPWSRWDARLGPLLIEYAPSGAANTHYPFRRLMVDELWTVEGADVDDDELFVRSKDAVRDFKRRTLDRRDPEAGLPPAVADRLLRFPLLQSQVTRLLLHIHFPPTLWQDVLDDVGVVHDLAEIIPFPRGLAGPLTGDRRSPTFASDVLSADGGRCVVCAYDGRDASSGTRRPVGLDAAHVRWWTHEGPDDVHNGMALCALHHRLLDRGMIGFDPDMRGLLQSPHFVASAAAWRVSPQATAPARLESEHLDWQIRNVFKAA